YTSNASKAEKNTHHDFISSPQSQNASTLKELEDNLEARVVQLNLNEAIPVNPDPADDSYFEQQLKAHLDTPYIRRKNLNQYKVALLRQQQEPGRKYFLKLIFEADSHLMNNNDNLFLELFYKTGGTVRFKVRQEVEAFNKDTFEDRQIMQCDKVPVRDYEKYLQFLNEKWMDLLK
ncbi:hypothetical protein BgiMline_016800, partial [Biomphalaria glabrata]